MSHFTRLKIQVRDEKAAHKVAEKFGWTITHEGSHVNSFSKEEVRDCDVYRENSSGKIRMVVLPEGDVIHDAFYMGRDANKFLCEYSEEVIRSMAAREGATVQNCGVDQQGNRVLELVYF
jgi:hypothetical protein